jgi:hypothetical protein
MQWFLPSASMVRVYEPRAITVLVVHRLVRRRLDHRRCRLPHSVGLAGGVAAPDEREAVEKAAAEFKQYVVMLVVFWTTVLSSAAENLCSSLEVVWR